MDFIEKLGLKDPFLLLAPAAEAVDSIAQGAVGFPVKHLRHARGEQTVRFGPGHLFIQIHEVALVDPRRSGIDDHEHLGREVLAPAIEDDTGDLDAPGLIRMGPVVELQRGQPVLSVDDQVFLLRLLQAGRRRCHRSKARTSASAR
jgi:hypothetical protein